MKVENSVIQMKRTSTLLLFLKKILFLFERGEEREKGRQRNTDVREKHRLVASCMCPDQTATQARALTGNWTGKLSLCRVTATQVSHPSQGSASIRTQFSPIGRHLRPFQSLLLQTRLEWASLDTGHFKSCARVSLDFFTIQFCYSYFLFWSKL